MICGGSGERRSESSKYCGRIFVYPEAGLMVRPNVLLLQLLLPTASKRKPVSGMDRFVVFIRIDGVDQLLLLLWSRLMWLVDR